MGIVLTVALAARKTSNAPPKLFFAIWLALLAFVALVAYAAARQKRKRREALEQFAMESGFLFTPKPDESLAARLAEIHVTSTVEDSSRARYSNILHGTAAGGEVVIADRTVGSGKSQTTTTIVAFKFASALPPFMVCQENVIWRVAEKFGYSDIDFDGAPDFSRRFFLHAKDEAAVRALFKPEVTQAFEQFDPRRVPYVSASGQWLVVSLPLGSIPVEKLRDFLQQAEMLANAFRRAQSGSVFA